MTYVLATTKAKPFLRGDPVRVTNPESAWDDRTGRVIFGHGDIKSDAVAWVMIDTGAGENAPREFAGMASLPQLFWVKELERVG